MTERRMSRAILFAASALAAALALILSLAWPDDEPPPAGPELPGPTASSLARVLPHERSAHRQVDIESPPDADPGRSTDQGRPGREGEGEGADRTTARGSRHDTLLEIDLFDGFERLKENDRPRYVLVLRLQGETASASETRIISVHSGRNRIEGLGVGEGIAELAGLPMAPRSIAMRRNEIERIVWDESDLVRHEFRPLRVIGFDVRGERVTGLGLALEGPSDTALDIAPIEDALGRLDLFIGPDWEFLLLTCKGYTPVPLREATYLAPAEPFIGHDPEPDRERVIRLRRSVGVVFY